MDSRPWPCFVIDEGSKMLNLSKQMQSHRDVRDSQIELLRIIAMVMMLILHANFLGARAPEHTDFLVNAPRAWEQMILEALCIVAVDTFVLISGWYGIQFRKRRLAGFQSYPQRQGLRLTSLSWTLIGLHDLTCCSICYRLCSIR